MTDPHAQAGPQPQPQPQRQPQHQPQRQPRPQPQPQPLPSRLLAPAPGWTARADVVVIGSGIAGLTTALRAAADGTVLVVTKDVLSAGSTRWAQGGIAAALGPTDSPAQHRDDTLTAGVGLCDEAAVELLVTEGPGAVRRLIEIGARFDLAADGSLALTREGGHHQRRVAHAGGDATGAEIQRALVAAVRGAGRIEVIEHALVLDLVTDAAGRVAGVTLHVMGEGQRDGVGCIEAGAVVLATGGMGQVFSATTNPIVSTGDGVALALRAGAVVRDLEFVQFHPTVLWLGPGARGQQPLVSEAVRGEGAVLVDMHGQRFMTGVHPLADLAPRDVVARAITQRMRETGADCVFLDAREFGEQMWRVRFPTILASCREHGIDPVTELIPVAPASHYASGGVRTDLSGHTSVPGLYACGEVACTGVHGANRLASNSLLEGLVFADRIAADIHRTRSTPAVAAPTAAAAQPTAAVAQPTAAGTAGLFDAQIRGPLQRAMTAGAGVLRSRRLLGETLRALVELRRRPSRQPCTETWEATNLLTVATALASAARFREETRGSHWRQDFPDRDDRRWLGHLDLTLREGTVMMHYQPKDTPGQHDELPASLDAELTAAGLAPAQVWSLASAAIEEDLAGGVDVTSAATVPVEHIATADFVARADGVVAGLPVAEAVIQYVSQFRAQVDRKVADGDQVHRGDVLMTVTGRTRDLLTAERSALNLLCYLSGVATHTRRWVDAVAGTGAVVRDTRKTIPGLRALAKYAVRCGGGQNHRMSLADAALVKDNHVIAAGGIVEAFHAVRAAQPTLPVEVEADSVEAAVDAVEAGAQLVLLDNMSVDEMRAAVKRVGGRAKLEASGGLTLAGARAVAETGVDYLAVGALTHSAPILDIACDLREKA
ncbi:MAG: L-aspartate oxidase [Sporichthyaceae bacterium]|nr:L-aspartate oxidase [Sporichthyaceae bacterium]